MDTGSQAPRNPSLEIQSDEPFNGGIKLDGNSFGGKTHPENRQEDCVDRRLAKHQTGKRCVVVAFRARLGRTRPFVTISEAQGVELAKRHVDRLAIMHADGASHWDMLHAGWETERSASTTPKSTATTASTPIGLKAISAAFAAWSPASTTTYRRSTCTSMQTTLHGLKTTDAIQTAKTPQTFSAMLWRMVLAGCGKATGSGRLKSFFTNLCVNAGTVWCVD